MTSALHTSPYTAEGDKTPEATNEAKVRGAVTHALLDWYGKQRRPLPWRATRDPYCIWVSEVMLQQTQVATVIGFYERWLRRFPDVAALASAETEDVLRAWEGLGYYSRARNLQRAAQRVVERHGGQLPASVSQLLELPGIGRYSAGAIASIAFALDEPAIDGNIVRVLTRVFALRGDPKRAPLAGRLWQLARELLPSGRAGEFNQALMELGATCCTPRVAALRHVSGAKPLSGAAPRSRARVSRNRTPPGRDSGEAGARGRATSGPRARGASPRSSPALGGYVAVSGCVGRGRGRPDSPARGERPEQHRGSHRRSAIACSKCVIK